MVVDPRLVAGLSIAAILALFGLLLASRGVLTRRRARRETIIRRLG